MPSSTDIARLRAGVMLADGLARPVRVEVAPRIKGGGNLTLVMTEGRKREVRRLMYAVGFPVVTLKRVRFGPVHLGELPLGEWDVLSSSDVVALAKCVTDA